MWLIWGSDLCLPSESQSCDRVAVNRVRRTLDNLQVVVGSLPPLQLKSVSLSIHNSVSILTHRASNQVLSCCLSSFNLDIADESRITLPGTRILWCFSCLDSTTAVRWPISYHSPSLLKCTAAFQIPSIVVFLLPLCHPRL